jgi:hypothetical protein
MLIGLLYFLLALAIIAYELNREKAMLLDLLSVATLFYLANIVVPAIIIHMTLDTGLVKADSVRNLQLVNNYYHLVQPVDKWIVLLGSIVAYMGLVIGYNYVESRGTPREGVTVRTETPLRITWVMLFFVFCLLILIYGNSLMPGDPVKGVLLSTFFRAEDPFYAFERNALNANIYSSIHAFLLIAVLGYALWDEKRRGAAFYLLLTACFLLIDAIASGARRNLLIAAIIIYMYIANRSNRYRIHYMLPVLLLSAPLLYFGKTILRNLTDFDIGLVIGSDVTPLQQALTAACDIGISHVQSLGILALYDGLPRFGLDHLFSLLRMIPFGLFDLEKPWPLRVVRITTGYLTGDPTAQDVPPGYIGQCWIDFPFLGFFIFPALHGALFALVNRGFKTINLPKSPFYLMVYLVIGYILALPFNSGSLDFVFSVDMFYAGVLILLLHVANSKARVWSDLDCRSVSE